MVSDPNSKVSSLRSRARGRYWEVRGSWRQLRVKMRNHCLVLFILTELYVL